MEWFTSLIKEIGRYLRNRDDTSIDRLNRLYTVAFLSAFVTLISTQQYIIGGRIVCWTPNEFTGAHIHYANDICWLGQTNYYLPENLTRLDSPSTPRNYPFLIYPWLPVILIAMTASFTAPYLLIWRGLSSRSGIHVKRLLETEKFDELHPTINYIFFKRYSLGKSGSNYVVCIYLLTKICYILIIFGQILIVNKLLQGDFWNLNLVQCLRILSVKYNMWSSPHFPIETLCDFMIRALGQNDHWYTIQCILPYNLFSKRLFALLTIWFVILFILNSIDLLFIWCYQRISSSSRRYEFILKYFRLYRTYPRKDENSLIISAMKDNKSCQDFIYRYLGMDGYFILILLRARLSELDMSILIVHLFERIIDEKNEQMKKKTSMEYSEHTSL